MGGKRARRAGRRGFTQSIRNSSRVAAAGFSPLERGSRWKKMQELDKIETLNPEWICQPKTEGQIQNGTEQNNCDDCVDNLFKKAQKVGAVCSEHAKADTVITLWKNGFTVNEGELRSYTDVANRCFLDSIKKGELPLELQKICDKEEVDVKMDDKKDKLYTSPKAVFHPFSGPGYRLGRISHIRDFIIDYQRHQGRRPFTLTTSLPFQELLNESLTLEEANLKNAVVVQRLKNNIEPFRSFSS
ncbi:UBX domain-containing protein 2A isoform X4 [Crotalus tigris]|uniref:UBX domain-containing protein 2A isoform X4 n=1 Tax=Crotalus tigris TaxID=88082 RepID=UPI00192F64AB|nr:UBX domain-containing protein 2A isoform X4 [Crotalus tigris]